jgi:hypothetical protein
MPIDGLGRLDRNQPRRVRGILAQAQVKAWARGSTVRACEIGLLGCCVGPGRKKSHAASWATGKEKVRAASWASGRESWASGRNEQAIESIVLFFQKQIYDDFI